MSCHLCGSPQKQPWPRPGEQPTNPINMYRAEGQEPHPRADSAPQPGAAVLRAEEEEGAAGEGRGPRRGAQSGEATSLLCLHHPSCSPCPRTRRSCLQSSPQLPSGPGCGSGDYQRTSLSTAWGIQLNPVNVFILKQRCTFHRNLCWLLVVLFCLHFFCKKETQGLNPRPQEATSWPWRCPPCLCAPCASLPSHPAVGSLLVPD